MKKSKKERLEKAGWRIGTAKDFLELTDEEVAFIEIKLALSKYLKDSRVRRKITQNQLAKIIHSSQSRIAKMEAGDPSVSFDLLLKSLLSIGTSPKQLARVIGSLS